MPVRRAAIAYQLKSCQFRHVGESSEVRNIVLTEPELPQRGVAVEVLHLLQRVAVQVQPLQQRRLDRGQFDRDVAREVEELRMLRHPSPYAKLLKVLFVGEALEVFDGVGGEVQSHQRGQLAHCR